MNRRSRSQSLTDPKRSHNVNDFKRSGSVQDLKVLGGRKDMLNKKKTKLTRQESVEIRANDEGINLTTFHSAIKEIINFLERSGKKLMMIFRISEVAP